MMKTVTTLTAVVTLVAGISIAQAQGTMGTRSSGMQAPQTTGNAAFCIATSPGGPLNCKYASLAACEKDAKPQNLNCSPNPKKGFEASL
jgi:hypothetical protein